VKLKESESGTTTAASQSGEKSDRSRLHRTFSRRPGAGFQRRSGAQAARDRSGAGHSRFSDRRSDRRSRSRSPRGMPGSMGGGQRVGAHERHGSDRSGPSGRRQYSRRGSRRNQSSCGTPACGTPTAGASSSSTRNGTPRVTLTPRRDVDNHREQRGGVRLEPARR